MKTHEKIQSLMNDAHISVKDLCNRQKEMFKKEDRIKYGSFRRMINGETQLKMPILLKICQLLGVSITEIIADTDYEDLFIIQKSDRFDSYTAQPNIPRDILSIPTSSFMVQEITIPKGEKTNVERSPQKSDITYRKFIYVVEGWLKIFINDQEYNVKRRGVVMFRSDLPHYYMNIYNNDCVILTFLMRHYLWSERSERI